MMQRRALFAVIGFLLFLFGFIALVLLLVGMRLSFLTWIDFAGPTTGLVIRLAMILGGIMIMYLALTDFDDKTKSAQTEQ